MGFAKIDFTFTDDEDFAATLDLTDNTDGSDYDATAVDWLLQVTEGDNSGALLEASSDAGTITHPNTNEVAWRFLQATVAGALCAGRTYDWGLIQVNGSGHRTQIAKGTLAIVDGGLA